MLDTAVTLFYDSFMKFVKCGQNKKKFYINSLYSSEYSWKTKFENKTFIQYKQGGFSLSFKYELL